MLDEAKFNEAWEAQGRRGESEHQVYFDPATGLWWKRNLLNFHDGSISAYLERIAAQKFLFPGMAPQFEGFTNFDGHLYPIISQPDAIGAAPTDAQVAQELEAMGFVEVFETGQGMSKARQLAIAAGIKVPPADPPQRAGFFQRDTGIWLEDVHSENAVLREGRLEVFDPVTYFIDPHRFEAAARTATFNPRTSTSA